jgi:uncharacterized protein (TIGR03000 family)
VLAVGLAAFLGAPGPARAQYRGFYYANGYWWAYDTYRHGYNPGYYAQPYPVAPHGVAPGHYGGYASSARPAEPGKSGSIPPGTYSYPWRPSTPSTYPATRSPAAATSAAPAEIELHVPADAKVWFDDTKTTQGGTSRRYVSPPLAGGRSYSYEVRVRWVEGGRPVTQSRRITVEAGGQVSLAFPAPA